MVTEGEKMTPVAPSAGAVMVLLWASAENAPTKSRKQKERRVKSLFMI